VTCLSAPQIEFVAHLVYDSAAIVLDGKEYLIESRLDTLAHRLGFASAAALLDAAMAVPSPALLHWNIVEALTTHETYFFRDGHPFQALAETVLPDLLAKTEPRPLRIWSAACSTGQEPYSIAMLLEGILPLQGAPPAQILATDVSTAVLIRAQRGLFSESEIERGLTLSQREANFDRLASGQWQARASLRSAISFAGCNLIGDWPGHPPFDLILLRNVLIYFDLPTRQRVLERMVQSLSPFGYILLGAIETTMSVPPALEPFRVGRTCFLRRHPQSN